MEIFNKSERIYTVKNIKGEDYRLAPQTSCEVKDEVAKKLIELYPTELMVIGEIKEEITKKEEPTEEEKPVVKAKAKKKA